MKRSLLKSPGLFSVYGSILTVVWMVSTLNSQILKSLYQSFDDCTKHPNYNWYHHHFHFSQFSSVLYQSRGTYLFFFRLLSILPCDLPGRQIPKFSSLSFFVFVFCLVTLTQSGYLAEIRRSVCISKSQIILCVSFSRTYSQSCKHHLFVWSYLNFLHNFQWITFPT